MAAGSIGTRGVAVKTTTTKEVKEVKEVKGIITASFSIESNLFVPRWGVKARDYDQFFSKRLSLGLRRVVVLQGC